MSVIKNKKGLTLMEMVVAMVVMSIIMMAVMTVFLPTYNAISNALEVAEVNSLFNSLSSVILSDIESARGIGGGDGAFTVTTRVNVQYVYGLDVVPDGEGRIRGRLTRGTNISGNPGLPVPVFAEGFYKRKTIGVSCVEANGRVTLSLTLYDRNGFEIANRTYIAHPVGLA
jgi:prepilin-type N-terminal cleavage/methylation domain-containing protein